MALNKTTLATEIKKAFKAQMDVTDDPDAALNDLAAKIADAVDLFVKSMEITYSAGLVAPPGGGPVTGVFTNTIS